MLKNKCQGLGRCSAGTVLASQAPAPEYDPKTHIKMSNIMSHVYNPRIRGRNRKISGTC